ncbi:SH3 and PX-domain-containing 3 [Favolaschia claudopus]|uniref:SH3 and PX-domain-containing 3 n=1 Tax=Favolaschia claudopus TaxID=2862362 RepID=A0AAW0BA73_9AGAR
MTRLFCFPPNTPTSSRLILLVAAVVLLSAGYLTLGTRSSLSMALVLDIPPALTGPLGHPTYEDIREYERMLPQHRIGSPSTRNRSRYLFFYSEAGETGQVSSTLCKSLLTAVSFRWNNVLQEQYVSHRSSFSTYTRSLKVRLLNTHLAYLANRGYVFVDYRPRDHPPLPDTFPNSTRAVLRVPMNAFTSGPTGGGSWGRTSSVPRPISRQWWDTVCPHERIVEVRFQELLRNANVTEESPGDVLLTSLAKELRAIPDECVSLIDGAPFDFNYINTFKLLPAWDTYGSSPTLTRFLYAPLITRAVARNFPLLSLSPFSRPPRFLTPAPALIPDTPHAGSALSPYPLAAFAPLSPGAPPLPGLLGIHYRRGDFAEHCTNLADWGADFNVWNRFALAAMRTQQRYPALPDDLPIPPGTSRRDAAYAHCYPSLLAAVARVKQVREDARRQFGQDLKVVYVSTNAERGEVVELAERLREDGWAKVVSSWDLSLAVDEGTVGQAVDMAVLGLAETIIGNAYSSMTSNVVQFRIAGGRHVNTSRFW